MQSGVGVDRDFASAHVVICRLMNPPYGMMPGDDETIASTIALPGIYMSATGCSLILVPL